MPSSTEVRVVVGMPLHDEVARLRPALESLLAQDADSFAAVVVDDSAADLPGSVVAGYLAHEPRLSYERAVAGAGLVANWRRAYEVALRLHPQARYFAWAGDHDLWEPSWLRRLVDELDAHPDAVLAYPRNDRILDGGEAAGEPWLFDTAGVGSAPARFVQTVRRMRAGDMVYGLFRTDALGACGVYRRVVMPDRLLLAELALRGEFRQVPEILWHRRGPREARYDTARKRKALFAGDAPAWTRLPWWATHAAALAAHARPLRRGIVAGVAYAPLTLGFHAARVVARCS